MKIGLVTNWNQKCAVAEYAKNLANYCVRTSRNVEFKIVTGLLNYEGVEAQTRDVDIIHFNYCRHAYAYMDPQRFSTFRGKGKPVILTFHESSDWQTRRLAANGVADWVVAHDKMRDGPPPPENLRTIPYGIPEVDLTGIKVSKDVGTFGSAFPWKGLFPLAWACGQLGIGLTAQLSEADPDMGQIQWANVREGMQAVCPQVEIIEGWRPQEEVIRELARCAVIALPFDASAQVTGISASVRFALAAKRPIALTRFAHFSDLYDYEDEVYFVDGNLKEKLVQIILDLQMGWERKPRRVLANMGWHRAAQMYCDLYEESLKSQEADSKAVICA